MRSTTKVRWLTIITLIAVMAVLTACTGGTPQSPTAVALTAGTEAAGMVPETPASRAENMTENETTGRAENMTENMTENETNGPPRSPQDAPAEEHDRRAVRPAPETITIPGTGTADAPPDFIQLHLGAIKHGDDPLEILGNVTQAISAMTDEANNQGIKSEDIQTSAVQVYEREVYDRETRDYKQEGFTAKQNTSVTIRDLEQADMIVGWLLEAVGSTGPAELTLQGVNSGIDDPEGLRLAALEKATRNLWDQARTVARTSNRGICLLLETQAEGAGQYHRKSGVMFDPPEISPVSAVSATRRDSFSSGISISPGVIEESIWMTGVFELTPIGMTDADAGCQDLP